MFVCSFVLLFVLSSLKEKFSERKKFLSRQFALTTLDNPFDPFEEFLSWFHFDTSKGYNSCALLGRIAKISNELSDHDQLRVIEETIDLIIEVNPTANLRKVVKET